MIEPECSYCGHPVPGFVQVKRKWVGTPVLYMGKHPITNSAMAYDFCDAECMIEWLAEILGMEVKY